MSWNEDSPFVLDLPTFEVHPEFSRQEQFKKWVQHEIASWSWLWDGPATQGSLNGATYNNNRNALNTLLSMLQSPLDLATERRSLHGAAHQAFHPGHASAVLPSMSAEGARILSIQEALGPDVGRWAFQIFARDVAISQVNQKGDLPLFLAAATFDETRHGELGRSLQQERTNYRTEITRLSNLLRKLESERETERANERLRARKVVRRLLRQTKALWDEGKTEAETKVGDALASIAKTEDYYRTQMALMAPVEYWRTKARAHAIWEVIYGLICLVFFGLAAWAIIEASSGSIGFLENLGEEARTSAYFITAGALLGGTTLLFWLGRVLVKLFLSEHHLRSECAEKAIMTQAFLSMETNNSSFGETERAIVLASIFRSSPDGIVKDEGPSDLAGTAILARLLSR